MSGGGRRLGFTLESVLTHAQLFRAPSLPQTSQEGLGSWGRVKEGVCTVGPAVGFPCDLKGLSPLWALVSPSVKWSMAPEEALSQAL